MLTIHQAAQEKFYFLPPQLLKAESNSIATKGSDILTPKLQIFNLFYFRSYLGRSQGSWEGKETMSAAL